MFARVAGMRAGVVASVLGASVLDGVHAGLDRALGVDVGGLTDAELADAVVEVHRAEARLAAVKARLVAGFDARHAYAADGAQTAAAWITHRCGVPAGQARGEVTLARSLRCLPALARGLADGQVGVAQAQAIARHHRNARTSDALARDEGLLVEHARALPWRSFVRVLAYWAQLADPDGCESGAEDRRHRRHLHLSQTIEGMWVLDGVLDPVAGATVAAAIRRIDDELFAADRRAGDLLARTPAQRRADALVELAHRAGAVPFGSRRPRPLVTILVGYETFAGRICELADGTVLAPGDVAALLDRAVIERAVFDGPSRVTDIGHQRRFVGALRRAIELRDRECTHPDCDVTAERCDGDHRIPWQAGGPTKHWNGQLRCPFHNHLRQRTQRPPPNLN